MLYELIIRVQGRPDPCKFCLEYNKHLGKCPDDRLKNGRIICEPMERYWRGEVGVPPGFDEVREI